MGGLLAYFVFEAETIVELSERLVTYHELHYTF